MLEEKIVLSNWLTDRFEVDILARNKNVEMRFLELLNKDQSLNLIDLGTGTGGNLVYLLSKIKSHQNWYLVEQDALLIEACKQRLKELFPQIILFENEANFKYENYQINLNWYHTDIIDFLHVQPFELHVDVVTASALFDVLPKSTFQKILDFTRIKNLILFSTLNYESTVFENPTDADELYAQLYQQHMKLPQDYGIKMGGNCKADILNLLNKTEKENHQIGKSNWVLNRQHSIMLKQLIQFFAESIPDLLKHKDEQQSFKDWIDLKNHQITNNQLVIEVKHFDFLLNCKLL